MDETIYRGLAGVNVDTSQICFIDGDKGELVYRGYDIRELTDATYAEAVLLLWSGELPTAEQLAAFRRTVMPLASLPPAVVDLLRGMPADGSPMHALRTAISALALYDPNPDGVDAENVRRIGHALLVQFPTLVATIQRVRAGLEPIAPDPDLSIAANFLYTLTGERPSDAATRVMDANLVLHAEHGSNASTFVARSTASSLTDVYSAITAGVGSLKGPLHGGANMGVMQSLEKIGSVEAVEPYVLGVLAKPGGRVMGFGHRVYRVLDPRAAILAAVSERLARESGDAKWFEMSQEMVRVMDREMSARGREVKPNVDFYSASVYRMLGFPTDMYTPLFAVARISGWMAHLYEQYADNRLVR
ncbi:MAG: citrate synthase, partial [bacterium]|nr:citrate synthase [bacterium]